MSKVKKFNIIDVLILCIVIVFAIGLGIRIFGKTSGGVKNTTDIIYTVEIKNVRQFTIDALEKSSVLTDKEGGKVIGEILSVSEVPYKTEAHISDGTSQVVQMPERYTCSVKIKSPAKYMNDKYNLAEDVDVSLGGTFTITTKYAKTTGNIVELSKGSVENN